MVRRFSILIFVVAIVIALDSAWVTSQSLTEGDAYKLLYENQLKSNDAVLKTIFYALGGLATAILAVFASNWWFNEKKVRDIAKDIDRHIRDLSKKSTEELFEKIRELENSFFQKSNNFETSILARFTELTEKMRSEASDERKNIEGLLEMRLNSFTENVNRQIDAAAKLNEERGENYKNSLDQMENRLVSKFTEANKTLSEGIKNEITAIKLTLFENEADIAVTKQLYSTAYTAYLNVTECWLELGYGKIHSYYLDKLLDIAKKMTDVWDTDLEISKRVLKSENLTQPAKAEEIFEELKKKNVRSLK